MSHACVLVTGGSGFIAGHCILQLLEQGYRVRTTVRSLEKEANLRSLLKEAGMIHDDRLSFVAADLTSDQGWSQAVSGADFVLHVASPVQPGHVKNEDDLVIPAREGTLRVLRTAQAAGVKRVVLTSAFHAVSWGHPRRSQPFTEKDWTILDGPGVDAYGKSKTLSERAAWDFIATHGGSMELTTMLPVAVVGPVLGGSISGSNHLIQFMLSGKMRALPDLHVPVVDVRDVALAHIQAMTTPSAAGERFLLSNGPALSMKDIASVIKAQLGGAAASVPTGSVPSFVLRIVALFAPDVRGIVPDLGYAKKTSNEKARAILNWVPRHPSEAIIAAAESMVEKGLVKA